MNSSTSHPRRMARPAALLAALSALGLSLTLLVTPALATHVEPIPINSGNPTCSDFAPDGATWLQFTLEGDDLANGTFSDGTLEVTISNYVNSSSGTPGA
ncbi:MAG TPA: hypothetical protein VK845_03170, partial [Gemmatimonadales bacterium]|nr:hypothetical protein [Gemmatimonadales bacterium]